METELKLALPCADPASLVQRLAKIPLLARRKAVQQQLHNIYYDMPDQRLDQQRVALRQGGEWEAAFDRTTWTVRRRDGSAVEVALDIGHIVVDDKRTELCELELELLAGDTSALFDIARQIANSIATLPLGTSKAARGYALARNALHTPQRAQPPTLAADQAMPAAALDVLREAFLHFTANLNGLLHTDDPELVHQARVGWRRFKTGLKLFKQLTDATAPAALQSLRPALDTLGRLRDLEVASLETLPMLANAYTDGDRTRQTHWRAMEQALTHAADHQRDALHQALCEPALGAALLVITQWLEVDLAQMTHEAQAEPQDSLKDWARQHTTHWHGQLKTALAHAHDANSAHRARILAKRLRYGIEALQPLLPKKRAKHWHQQASRLQSEMGAQRDMQQALALATRLQVDPSLLEFLRGVAVGKKRGR